MKNCISRRSFLKAAGILGAAGALAACGGSSASTSTAASTAGSTAASAAASSTSIKLWTYPIGGWGNDETVQGLVSSFNAKYPDIKVTVEYLDYTNGDDQVNTAIEGGSAPDGRSRASGCKLGRKGRYGSAERPVDRRCQEGHLRVR